MRRWSARVGVFAFEPDPENFRLLERNIQLNDFGNITVVPKAVSDVRGTTQLFLDAANYGAPSLCQSNVPTPQGTVEVEMVRLDDFFGGMAWTQAIDLLRMDVQGAERLVLDGAGKLLEHPRLLIVMEFWPVGLRNLGTDPQQFLTWLEDCGFRIAIIDEGQQRLQPATSGQVLDYCRAMESQWAAANLLLRRGERPEI